MATSACGQDLQKDPEIVAEGPKDTDPEAALQKTYDYRGDAEAIRLARLAMTKCPGVCKTGFEVIRSF